MPVLVCGVIHEEVGKLAADEDPLTPITVLLEPNGSGKSTVFDVFSFLSECFQFGLHPCN